MRVSLPVEFVKLCLLCLEGVFTYEGNLRLCALEEHVCHVVRCVVAVCAFGGCCEVVSDFALGSISVDCVGFLPDIPGVGPFPIPGCCLFVKAQRRLHM